MICVIGILFWLSIRILDIVLYTVVQLVEIRDVSGRLRAQAHFRLVSLVKYIRGTVR